MSIFTGSGVAIVTPFSDSGVNFDTFGKLIDFQIEQGTDAIVVCGTTGEPSTMTAREKEAAIAFAVERANKRVPVVAGTGGNNTAAVIEASRRAQALGANALLIVTPYYNKCTQAGAVAHYNAVADAVDLPIIVYNVPSRTSFNILPDTLLKMSEHPNIAAVKEASGNISQITEMFRLCTGNLDFYSGNDDHIFALLALGGKGVISVVANVAPRDTHELVAAFLRGDIAASRDLQFRLNPLVRALFSEVNPIPAKAALNLMGFDMGDPRMPLTRISEGNLEKLRAAMVDYGIRIKG
ncbi:MAG: 4-hydroxy-tetrahydrodipicolinate synthase [Clostridiales bacterium]|jgi:4-hydroxy-tetrahydrodipicolinate synthase|nr:4-hydroxy-tetrahydrodipicolinate synthase [Clostridiales bacterium]